MYFLIRFRHEDRTGGRVHQRDRAGYAGVTVDAKADDHDLALTSAADVVITARAPPVGNLHQRLDAVKI